MKMHVTRKQIMDNFQKVVYVPYCEAQTLLRYSSPICDILVSWPKGRR